MSQKEKIPFFIFPYLLGTGLFFGGILSVPHPEQCDISSTYHVHLYTRNIGNVKIQKWLANENDTFSYVKHNDFLPVTTFDLNAFYELDSYGLFEGKDNIDYIHYQIETNRDYMRFYYYYEETDYVENEDGETEEVTHIYEGWTNNPRHEGVTGKVKIYHTKYYAYKLVQNGDQLELEKSPSVDDIRTILNEYPYVSEDTNHEVTETFYFIPFELPYLNLDEITPFYTPTVEDNPLDSSSITDNAKIKKIDGLYS